MYKQSYYLPNADKFMYIIDRRLFIESIRQTTIIIRDCNRNRKMIDDRCENNRLFLIMFFHNETRKAILIYGKSDGLQSNYNFSSFFSF